MRLHAAACGLLWVLVSAQAQAQRVIVHDDGEIEVLEGFPEGLVLDGQVQAVAPVAGAAGTPSPRQQKLQQLDFDRRPSTILSTWSTPPKAPEPEAVPPTEPPKTEEATPAPATPKTPEEEAAEKAAAEAQAKAKAEAEKQAAETKALEGELSTFQRQVTLGEWEAVKNYLAGLTVDERKVGYQQLLQSLANGPKQRPPAPQQGQPYLEKNRFSSDDLIALALAAPDGLQKEHTPLLGQLLAQALQQGHQLERFLELARAQFVALAEPPVDRRRQLAQILVAANQPLGLEGLLPTVDEAQTTNDREALNLISRYCLAQNDKEAKDAWLEEAWRATQAVLAVGEVGDDEKSEALKRAVFLAPKIQEELGQAWLDESFSARPERGMEILASIGAEVSTALSQNPMGADQRFTLLELQTHATKALLSAAPELADQWRSKLQLLALNWLAEAEVTYQYDESGSLGPRRQRDPWGNYYYFNWNNSFRGQVPTALTTEKILDIRPSDEWIARLDATLVPRFQMIFAQLLLKVGEEAQAFPYIEELAHSLPRQAKILVDEFVRVWTKNHDPNESRQQENEYIFFYGFEERANGIPLTRSKQDRNLRELGEWVARLKKLPVEVDDHLISTAFTTAHSTAEIYRLETIEGIFGPLGELEPATLAALAQRMRGNLLTIWRDPALQEDKKTKRRQADIQAEVLRGYELARRTIDQALAEHAQSWQLHLALAALQHDENDFRRELKKDVEFSQRRQAAFQVFRRAAELYGTQVGDLEEAKESIEAYDLWFHAALGACDLRALDEEKLLAPDEIPAIRAALLALPADRIERHVGKFAGSLFTRMSAVKPVAKMRFVREGLAIVGDHKLAREAREVSDYYGDLVSEIQLRATIDGSDRVGHAAPFGLLVELRHTREIERESGGFGKYLQNQNSQMFSWNYGRPPEDYRDKFETAARAALGEHFEVQSVTFNDPETKSKAEAEYGWRRTPYAYLLLQPKGPQIDRLPPLRLDLDFLDTTGYAVLPVESPALPLDASTPAGEPRPFEKLTLVQSLDERQARAKKLVLEIKASARGLVGELDQLVAFAPEGFDVVKTDDQGLSVSKFDEDGERVLSERLWTLTLQAKPELEALPTTFAFATSKVEDATVELYRYVDADLAKAEPVVNLEQTYGEPSRTWFWWLGGGLVVAVLALIAWRKLPRKVAVQAARFPVPENVTPFTVLGLLRDIEARNGLDPEEQQELALEIRGLEEGFFGDRATAKPDLLAIASSWSERAS